MFKFKKPTATIEMVHHDFDIAAETALKAAETVLENTALDNRLEQLEKIGFNRVLEVEHHQQRKRMRSAAEVLKNYVTHYMQQYPQNKFITNDQVTDICAKYGFIFGKSTDYIGIIPVKNQEEILAFKCREEDQRYGRDTRSVWEREISYASHIAKTYSDSRSVSAFFVVAPPEMFNLQNKVVSNYRIIKDDPIVLYSVAGGYLVVTAWGPEAKEVVTPAHN